MPGIPMLVDCGISLAGQRAEPANASWLALGSTRCTSHLLSHCRSHLCCYIAGGVAPAGKRHEIVVLPQIDARGRAQPGAFGREEAGVGLPDGGAPACLCPAWMALAAVALLQCIVLCSWPSPMQPPHTRSHFRCLPALPPLLCRSQAEACAALRGRPQGRALKVLC